LTTVTSSPAITVLSSSIADFPSAVNEFTTERICQKLIEIVIKSLKTWRVKSFAFPAENPPAKEELEPSPGFVSCESCFQTYSSTCISATRVFNAHICNFMGWDGMGWEIFENRPIRWDGIPFKNLSSRPMGRFFKSHPSHAEPCYRSKHQQYSMIIRFSYLVLLTILKKLLQYLLIMIR
jgi:hypothetical protein